MESFYFEIRSYFEGWLKELNISTFEQLQNLIILDQMKKRSSPEYREHYLDQWKQLTSPSDLADKFDTYENLRNTPAIGQKKIDKSKEGYASGTTSFHKKVASFSKREIPIYNREERSSLKCYGCCGKPGFIKSRCPDCSPIKKEVISNNTEAFSIFTKNFQPLLIDVTLCGRKEGVCADTGSSHSIAGEKLFKVFQKHGQPFETKRVRIRLAEGQQPLVSCYTTQVMVEVEGKQV